MFLGLFVCDCNYFTSIKWISILGLTKKNNFTVIKFLERSGSYSEQNRNPIFKGPIINVIGFLGELLQNLCNEQIFMKVFNVCRSRPKEKNDYILEDLDHILDTNKS